MKRKLTSIGSILLAIMIVFSLSYCSSYYELVEIKFYDIFTNEEQIFRVAKQFLNNSQPTKSDAYSAQVHPKSTSNFDQISGNLGGSTAYRGSVYSEKVVLFSVIDTRSIYCFINASDNLYVLSNPYVQTFGYETSANNVSKRVSDPICFPFYLLSDLTGISLSHELELDKEHEITCTKEQMKAFYVNLDKFKVEDTADGFFVNGFREDARVTNKFSEMKNYKFAFVEKDNTTFLVLSIV